MHSPPPSPQPSHGRTRGGAACFGAAWLWGTALYCHLGGGRICHAGETLGFGLATVPGKGGSMGKGLFDRCLGGKFGGKTGVQLLLLLNATPR